jgi:hypothetical protein
MKPTPTQEMEQRIRMRFAFAMSSFGRMFLPHGIKPEMRSLCNEWSQINDQPPRGDLYEVDRYFLNLWKNRNESQERN